MKTTRNILMGLLWGCVLLAVLLVVCFETGLLPKGTWQNYVELEVMLRLMMELALGFVPLALYLFKFEFVHKDLLRRKESALRLWGTCRLLMLMLPMVLNTLLYYMFMQSTYGYLAIMMLLCLPFVYPTTGRCMADVEE
ncbi:MAG: hypothetical protein IJ527_06950 [Prevotella sp.]|nr:hypothetical protein [Prevotella sp.]